MPGVVLGLVAGAAGLVIIYYETRGSFWIYRMNLVAIYAIVIIGWNLLLGLSGQFSLGQAAFFGIAGYTSASLASDHGVPVMVAVLAGTLAAVVIAAAVAVPLLRFRGLYLALVTLALAVVTQSIAVGWKSFTGGTSGRIGIPGWHFWIINSRSTTSSFVFLWILVGIAWISARAIRRSPFGKTVIAQREDETLAKALGLAVPRLRAKIFLTSVVYAGISGGLFAHYQNFLDPSQVGMFASFDIVVAGLVGGAYIPIGGIFGSFVHVVLPASLGEYAEWRPLIFGCLLLAVMMVFPGGIAGGMARIVSTVTHLATGRAKARPVMQQTTARAPREAAAREPLGSVAGTTVSEQETVLSAVDIARHFGGVFAVDGVSLEVTSREVLAVIGPNGAGKTTLFNLLCGLVAPDRGLVEVNGTNTTGLPPWEIARLGLARTFQTPHVLGMLSVRDNVALGAYGKTSVRLTDGLLGRQRLQREIEPEVVRAAELCGVVDFLDHPASELSLVQQRFVELARALASNPRVILCDESGAGLTDAELNRLADLLLTINRSLGIALVVVDHRMSLILDIADRVIVLDQGKQLAMGTGDEIVENPDVLAVYLGSDFAVSR